MLGSSSILALCLLAAAPAGSATASDDPDDGLTMPASFQAAGSLENKANANGKTAAGAPKLLPRGQAYEDRNLPSYGSSYESQEGIPGLPPVPDDAPAPLKPAPKPSDDVGEATCSDGSTRCPRAAVYGCPNRADRLRNWLNDVGFDSWLEQGSTLNTLSPRDHSNGPVTFNNRSNEYQLNQAYFRLKRDVNTEGDVWDLGGRIDLLYGTDSLYTTSRGLETFDDLDPKWNAQQYGLAMPQAYAQVFAPWGNGISMKLGHFYSAFGYEAVTPLDNFFYSHSYIFQYGEPFTYTGFIGSTKLGCFTIEAGMTRGWNNWEDNNDDVGFVGGIGWSSDDKRTSVSLNVDTGRQQADPDTNVRTIYSLVIQQKIGENWQYVFQNDYANEPGEGVGGSTASWYGIDQYLFYTINERWKAGTRFEWFHDQNGSRVPLPGGVHRTGDYYELSTGLNWKPHEQIVVRPELRWDWTSTPDLLPFGDGTRSNQLLLDCDVVVRF